MTNVGSAASRWKELRGHLVLNNILNTGIYKGDLVLQREQSGIVNQRLDHVHKRRLFSYDSSRCVCDFAEINGFSL